MVFGFSVERIRYTSEFKRNLSPLQSSSCISCPEYRFIERIFTSKSIQVIDDDARSDEGVQRFYLNDPLEIALSFGMALK